MFLLNSWPRFFFIFETNNDNYSLSALDLLVRCSVLFGLSECCVVLCVCFSLELEYCSEDIWFFDVVLFCFGCALDLDWTGLQTWSLLRFSAGFSINGRHFTSNWWLSRSVVYVFYYQLNSLSTNDLSRRFWFRVLLYYCVWNRLFCSVEQYLLLEVILI